MSMTRKQAGFLWSMTGRKFWEPEVTPGPTMQEASALIAACMAGIKEKGETALVAVDMVRRWFPDFPVADLRMRWRGGKKGGRKPESSAASEPALPGIEKSEEPAAAAAAPKVADPEPEPEEEPEEEPAAAVLPVVVEPCGRVDEIVRLFRAGIRNVWLHGPAGCGKSTIARQVADKLGVPCTILSCNSGTSPCDIIGYKFPSPCHSPISAAFMQAGVVVLDDATYMDETAAGALMAVLASGEFTGPAGHVVRNAACYVIVTSNTTGDGGSRMYSGNSKWDAATVNRFAGAKLAIEYDAAYETGLCGNDGADVLAFVRRCREYIKTNGLQRLATTRELVAGLALKRAGFGDWRARLVADWSESEQSGVGVK